MTLLQLPKELIQEEIFSYIDPPDRYSLSATCSDLSGLCDDMQSWQHYLASLDHETIQHMAIAAIKERWYGGERFFRMLIEATNDLQIIIDERTLLRSYYALLELGERYSELAKSVSFGRKMPEFNLGTTFSIVDGKIRKMIDVLDSLSRLDIESLHTPDELAPFFSLIENYDFLVANMIQQRYIGDRIVEALGERILWIVKLSVRFLYDKIDDHGDRGRLYDLFYEIVGSYVFHLTATQVEQFLQYWNGGSRLFLQAVMKNVSYDLYQHLRGHLSDAFDLTARDASMWKLFLSNFPNRDENAMELMINGYSALTPEEWCLELQKFNPSDHKYIIEESLDDSERYGYTKWNCEARRLVGRETCERNNKHQ